MKTLPARATLSGELLWWDVLIDTSQCWGNRLKKRFWESVVKTVHTAKVDASPSGQVQDLGSASHFVDVKNVGGKISSRAEGDMLTSSRISDATCTPFGERIRKLFPEVHGGVGTIFRVASVQERSMNCGRESNIFASSLSADLCSRSGVKEDGKHSCFGKRVSWDTTFAGEGPHGNEPVALGFSKEMSEDSVRLDKVALLFVSRGCGHGQCFENTGASCGLGPCIYNGCSAKSHYAFQGLKHLMTRTNFSRSFALKDINALGRSMLSAGFSRALSTSTEKQCDEDVGEQQSPSQYQSSGQQQSSLELPESKPQTTSSWPNPDNAASYVLMSNIYADGDRWDEVKRINEMRLKARAWKKPGKAYVEIKAKVHEFIVGDRTHQDSVNIYEKLRKIKRHMGHIGYVPNVDLILENRSYYDPYAKR